MLFWAMFQPGPLLPTAAALLLLVLPSFARRPLAIDDWNSLLTLADPQLSPDGAWVAYTVSSVDVEKDKQVTQVWMASWDGRQTLQLTRGSASASSPRWSPDGRYLAFTSDRPGEPKGSQVWMLDRRGGEAVQLTNLKDLGLSSYEWSPDGTRLALVLLPKEEPEDTDAAKPKPPKPLVIDRYHFKQDIDGYLSEKRNHIYLFEVATHKLEQLTSGPNDETAATWSPDGTKIAFLSSADKDPDRTLNAEVFVVAAQPGAVPQRLTTSTDPAAGPLAWSPDSTRIAFLRQAGGKYSAYSQSRPMVVPLAGGEPSSPAPNLDRPFDAPRFSSDGKQLIGIVSDDRIAYPAALTLANNSVQPLLHTASVTEAFSAAAGHTVLLEGSDNQPSELYALEGGGVRPLTHHNDAFLEQVSLGSIENVEFKSHDGTDVHALMTKPVGFAPGHRYPLLLYIHGGPNGQDQHEFIFRNHLYANHGYLVLNVNYRGSSGRGFAFGSAILADWGNKEVADLLAGVDSVVNSGLADPNRLIVGGWSYGGILTDYLIASTTRFKAAISGAGSANWFGIYGIDEYTFQYDTELGPPWKNPEAWIKLSYPFFHADRIHTPTLFMGGDKDFNVPVAGGEQMYQALRTLGVPTELVIYPGEFHEFQRPSFLRDRLQRDLAWYEKYLKP